MAKTQRPTDTVLGASTPFVGVKHPTRFLALLAAGTAAVALMGCSSKTDQTQTLEPQQLGMSSKMAPTFDDGETQLYEARMPVKFPIVAPGQSELSALRKIHVQPFGRSPWLSNNDEQVRVTWTLSNLDAQAHNVELLVDPWNEFGRYWPGMQVQDPQRQQVVPNLSGIDIMLNLEGKGAGDKSRRHGTFTVQDMNELAIDFATAINIIKNVPMQPVTAMGDMNNYNGPVTLVNHAFAVENRSYDDPLIQKYIPKAIPALTGFDIGLRTTEQANVAVEFTVELVEKDGGRKIAPRGSTEKTLRVPTTYYTIDYAGG
jgi:hypothetical protein